MTILGHPFHNNNNNNNGPGCLGMCNGGTAEQIPPSQQHGTIHSHRQRHGLSPEDQQTTREVDTMLSQALNNLTFEERQEQQDVLHGVDNKVTEDASLTETGLKELDDHLLKSKKGSVYELAESMDPDYVTSRDFRLIFLRTDRYQPKDAAKRMLQFFELKQKLFGTEKLVKDITLDDMDEDDIACIETGSLQPTGRDLSGRQVLVLFPGWRKFKKLENEMRAQYYITMSVLKSKETQIRGCTMVIYSIGEDFQDRSGGRGYAQCTALQMTIPPYKASFHCVLDTLHDYMLHGVAIKVLPPKMRARLKVHYGSHMECQYQLSTFGILPGLLPFIPGTNTINSYHHREWLKSHSLAQQTGSSSIMEAKPSSWIITIPNPKDVLCFRATKGNSMGNQSLLVLVKMYSKAYC